MLITCPDDPRTTACSDFVGCCAAQTCNSNSCLDNNTISVNLILDGIPPIPVDVTYTTKVNKCGLNRACELARCLGCCRNGTQNGQGHFDPLDGKNFTSSLVSLYASFTGSHRSSVGVPSNTPGEITSGTSATNLAIPTLLVPPSTASPTLSDVQKSATPASSFGNVPTRTPETSTTKSPNTATVAGGVTGGIVALAILLAILLIYFRRRTTGPLQGADQRRFPIWGSGQIRPIEASGAELQEIKQGPSPTSSLLHPPSSWPLPPLPGYTPYRPHENELDRSPPNVSQPSAGSPHTFDTRPPPESPPSPPPLKTRSSQDSADDNSEAQSVSPISSHYQHHPFDESEDLKSSVYSEISSNDLFHTHNKQS